MGIIDNHYTNIHDRSSSPLDTGTPINSGGVELVLCTQTSSRIEMMEVFSTYNIHVNG